MRASIIIPILGQVHETKGIVKQILAMASTDYETVLINNTVDPNERAEWRNFIEQYLKPQNLVYIENEDNLGMVRTLQQGYESSHGDVLIYLHTDLFIYKYGWDKDVLDIFEQDAQIGLAGFFGHRMMSWNAARGDCMSNMLEAEIHGSRMDTPREYVVGVDGFSIICRRKMLDKKNGFDTEYKFHHVYDKDISMESLARGYKNICINVPVHHWSGKTANSAQYQDWINKQMNSATGDMDTMRANLERFNNKWAVSMPLFVDKQGNLNKPVNSTI